MTDLLKFLSYYIYFLYYVHPIFYFYLSLFFKSASMSIRIFKRGLQPHSLGMWEFSCCICYYCYMDIRVFINVLFCFIILCLSGVLYAIKLDIPPPPTLACCLIGKEPNLCIEFYVEIKNMFDHKNILLVFLRDQLRETSLADLF